MRLIIQLFFTLSILTFLIVYTTKKFYQYQPIWKIINCENTIEIIWKDKLTPQQCKNYKLYYEDILRTHWKTIISINNKKIILSSWTILKIQPSSNNLIKIFLLIWQLIFPDKNQKININTPAQQLILRWDILALRSEISWNKYILNIKKTKNFSEQVKYLIKENNLNSLFNNSKFKSDILQEQLVKNIEKLLILEDN